MIRSGGSLGLLSHNNGKTKISEFKEMKTITVSSKDVELLYVQLKLIKSTYTSFPAGNTYWGIIITKYPNGLFYYTTQNIFVGISGLGNPFRLRESWSKWKKLSQDYQGEMDNLFSFLIDPRNNIKQMLEDYISENKMWTPHPDHYSLSMKVSTDPNLEKECVKEIFSWHGEFPMLLEARKGILKDIVEIVAPLIESKL